MAKSTHESATRLKGFPPIANHRARILVLGSMPSAASLAAGQYYAFKKNQFWPIVGECCGFDPDARYTHRKNALKVANIALWDVVKCCSRVGSLDSAIDNRSIVVNDFVRFLAAHSRIKRIFFNGGKAAKTWRKHVRRRLPAGLELEYRILPSTSPANARMSYLEKLKIWRGALQC